MIDWVTTRWRQWAGKPSAPSVTLTQVVAQRPVVAAGHVVLARPHQLHRPPAADVLGDVHALGDVVGLEVGAPAERAAGEQGLHLHRAGSAPTIRAVLSWSMVGICEPEVSFGLPPPISATQFIGSIGAWARNGKS